MGRPRKLQETPADIKNLVTVAFAEDMELAEQYKRQLLENSIPAAIEALSDQKKMPMAEVAVMVPEEFLEQAYTFLSRQAACDDFFDMVFGSDGQTCEQWDDED